MRNFIQNGVCQCCGKAGAVWSTTSVEPLDFGPGTDLVLEVDTALPDLCDHCEYAQRRWDARQYEIKHLGSGYPFMDGPPKSPPVRRPTDVELAADGWPK